MGVIGDFSKRHDQVSPTQSCDSVYPGQARVDISSLEGSPWEWPGDRDCTYSQFQRPLQDSKHSSPSPVSLHRQDHSTISPLSASEYARGPNNSLISAGMHYF